MNDTLVNGEALVVMHAEGYVDDTARGVEVLGDVLSVPEAMGLFANRNFYANGNLNVDGHIHINGDGDFGPGDSHLKSGTYDEGYSIDPPAVYTDPDAFPGSTFYRVIGEQISPNRAKALIEKWDRVAQQWVRTDSLSGNDFQYVPPDAQYPDGQYRFAFKKQGNNPITEIYFNYSHGPFRLDQAAGDSSVVIDFGWPTPGKQTVTHIEFHNSTLDPLRSTIINTRFTGITDEQRIESCGGWWVGGNVTFGSKVVFAPENCVAMIATQLGPEQGQQPNAQGQLGTEDRPALTYVTGNVEGLKGDLQIYGALISLCDINSQGGPDVFHDPAFLDCIPQDVLGEEGAGLLKFLEWREVGL
jgi:hypothetical protein